MIVGVIKIIKIEMNCLVLFSYSHLKVYLIAFLDDHSSLTLMFTEKFLPECTKKIPDPIYKAGDKNIDGNYRLISLLSVYSEVFELILKTKINKDLEKYNMPEKQFGFLEGRSTQDAIPYLRGKIVRALNNNFSRPG